jgi:Na+-transporting NADH:ubiquinone oxidoreductase subunit C
MTQKRWYAVVYMFGVTAFFSSMIIGLARVTAERVHANEQLALERAVLTALGQAQGKTNAEIHRMFVEEFEPMPGDNSFKWVKDGTVVGYAVGIAGKGFWAPIAGIIGLKPDRRTVTGIAFYEQNETPGLGAEITKPAFRRQFEGLELAPGPQPISIRPYGAQLDKYAVHAISGATQTCMRLEVLINEDLRQWLEGPAEEAGK